MFLWRFYSRPGGERSFSFGLLSGVFLFFFNDPLISSSSLVPPSYHYNTGWTLDCFVLLWLFFWLRKSRREMETKLWLGTSTSRKKQQTKKYKNKHPKGLKNRSKLSAGVEVKLEDRLLPGFCQEKTLDEVRWSTALSQPLALRVYFFTDSVMFHIEGL